MAVFARGLGGWDLRTHGLRPCDHMQVRAGAPAHDAGPADASRIYQAVQRLFCNTRSSTRLQPSASIVQKKRTVCSVVGSLAVATANESLPWKAAACVQTCYRIYICAPATLPSRAMRHPPPPPRKTNSSTASLVVPGSGLTMLLFALRRRLSRHDFPALGLHAQDRTPGPIIKIRVHTARRRDVSPPLRMRGQNLCSSTCQLARPLCILSGPPPGSLRCGGRGASSLQKGMASGRGT